MVHLCSKHCKVVLHSRFLPLHLLLQLVYVLLLVPQQKHQFLRKNVRFVHQITQVRCLAASHRHSRTRNAVPVWEGGVIVVRHWVAVVLWVESAETSIE